MTNILVFPAGTEIALEIHRALRYAKGITLFGDSSEPSNPGKYLFANYTEELPFITEGNFIEALNNYIGRNEISLVFPANDAVLTFLAQNQEHIHAKVIGPTPGVAHTCRSKFFTYHALMGVVSIPEIIDMRGDIEFPIFAKPDRGHSAIGVKKLDNQAQLDRWLLGTTEDYIYTEYLPGAEYTVDCFSNYKGELLFSQGRKRNRILNGISSDTFPYTTPEMVEMARAINTRLGMNGAWFFQVKEDKDGVLKLMEVAPRIAGSMALYRAKGVNFPLLSVLNAQEKDVKISPNSFEMRMDRHLSNDFKLTVQYDTVYVDLDDTLIIDGMINTILVRFLYQCVNNKKPIILITRNKEYEDLLIIHKLRALFHSAIWVEKGEQKGQFIKPNSIFIDDSYTERMSAQSACPVFDISEVECLIDERW